MKTTNIVQVLATIGFTAFVAVQLPPSNADHHSSDDDEFGSSGYATVSLKIVWIIKPPYTTVPTNASLDKKTHGLVQEAVLPYIEHECGYDYNIVFDIENLRADNESAMTKLLKEGKAHVGVPVIEDPNNPRYSEFLFFKFVDYPGADYITVDGKTDTVSVVLNAVAKSWPLLAVTLVLTAIAGVIMWALDTYWNPKEFPRSFFKGSWDGFWWSFISVTTVGYGDKAPKSVAGRIFSVIWIQMGLIIMAMFTANVTSALTALSLNLEPINLAGTKVAVLGNGTEYRHALKDGARPKVYNHIDDVIKAVKMVEVDGMLLDRFTASFYNKMDKLKNLVTVKKLDLSRDAGMIFVKNYSQVVQCLNVFRPEVWRSVQTITDHYKFTKQKPSKNFSVFEELSPTIKSVLYISLGVLAGLFVVGVFWEITCKWKAKKEQNLVTGVTANEEITMPERTSIYEDLEDGRKLLRQMQEHFDKLEAKVIKS